MPFMHEDKQRVQEFGISEQDCNYRAKANDLVYFFIDLKASLTNYPPLSRDDSKLTMLGQKPRNTTLYEEQQHND